MYGYRLYYNTIIADAVPISTKSEVYTWCFVFLILTEDLNCISVYIKKFTSMHQQTT